MQPSITVVFQGEDIIVTIVEVRGQDTLPTSKIYWVSRSELTPENIQFTIEHYIRRTFDTHFQTYPHANS